MNNAWTSVKTKLPKKSDCYLVIKELPISKKQFYDTEFYSINKWCGSSEGKVTHWMELPELPSPDFTCEGKASFPEIEEQIKLLFDLQRKQSQINERASQLFLILAEACGLDINLK